MEDGTIEGHIFLEPIIPIICVSLRVNLGQVGQLAAMCGRYVSDSSLSLKLGKKEAIGCICKDIHISFHDQNLLSR